ncbi:MAG: uracil-DNA glycosylase [Chlamydiae bacterium CG10_big_fil_rev_8_21_14_0_10_42_34]|nr:MAG: uracil-DNA glycosylase [Chlamydiae bacterium CG10_big_fil_rev_8_21_14_0_10_42_34]
MAIVTEKVPLIEQSWLEHLLDEFKSPYMRELEAFLSKEISSAEVYPPMDLVFNAFCQTPIDQVKVVIMGQDPYHGPNQAHGLSFSVPKGERIPPSLLNIYKEIRDDLGIEIPKHGCLEGWARQGVLLLNATLTVRANEAKSHHNRGWEKFTDRVVDLLCTRKDPIVFILWGRSAYEKFQHICTNASHHLVLTSPHPSPLSAYAGFLGCRHFSKTNAFLKKVGKTPIDWAVHS